MENQTMTIAEALAKGYDKCGYDNQDWQHLMSIDELSEDDYKPYHNGKIVLADTQAVTYSIDVDDIVDRIIDMIDNQEDINDEDHQMVEYLDEYKELKSDLNPIVDKINSYIGKHKVYYLTDIILTP